MQLQREVIVQAKQGHPGLFLALLRTVDLFPYHAPVLGHVDPDPSSDGTHPLASVAQECLELLRRADERAQSHTAFACNIGQEEM